MELILFAAIAAAGILVQSTVGFGGGLLVIPILTLFLAPSDAVPSYNLVGLAVNLLVLAEARAHIDWRRVGKLLVGAAVGAPLGAYFLAVLPTFWIAMAINVVTLSFAAMFLLELRVRIRDSLPANLAAGALSGVLGGVTAQSGPPVIIFGISQGWQKDAFRATLLGYFFFQAGMTATCFAVGGLTNVDDLLRVAAAFVPAIAAAHFGIRIKRRLPEGIFRRIVLLVVIGASVVGLANQVLRAWL